MPSDEQIGNRLKTLAMVVVFGIFVIYVPLRIAGSENHALLPKPNGSENNSQLF